MCVCNESLPGGIKVLRAFLSHPYFLGVSRFVPEYKIWGSVYPNLLALLHNPLSNLAASGALRLRKLGYGRVLVVVAGGDELREMGVVYYNGVRESGCEGKV
ncbi:hypothetical protein Nepgr_010252 [Nepenthes gracilis]|uniref:Uncharacterized protein n=1 Tax=Nepenthes gracilis TaxID=150966 RepID=A0AAD3XKW4_NEPGR|nr:hypothetical protein Nepgr_010252 [Nepenthes gracilis]